MGHYLELILYKAYAELRAEATRAYLGFLWWFVEPVLYMAVFYLVFELGLRRGGAEFVPFLLCGLVAWKWFASTVLAGANVLAANAGILQQVYLPKLIFPLVLILANTCKFSVILVLLLLFVTLGYGKPVGIHWLGLPVLLLLEFLFICALTVLAAAVVPFVPDLKLLLDNLMIMLFFISGIFFDIRDMSPQMQDLIVYNPMVVIIDGYRAVLLDAEWPQWNRLALIAVVSLVVLFAGMMQFRVYDRVYPKIVLR